MPDAAPKEVPVELVQFLIVDAHGFVRHIVGECLKANKIKPFTFAQDGGEAMHFLTLATAKGSADSSLIDLIAARPDMGGGRIWLPKGQSRGTPGHGLSKPRARPKARSSPSPNCSPAKPPANISRQLTSRKGLPAMNKPTSDGEPMLTVNQVAEQMNVSVKTVRRRIAAGKLPVIRDEGVVRIRPVDFRTYVARRRSE